MKVQQFLIILLLPCIHVPQIICAKKNRDAAAAAGSLQFGAKLEEPSTTNASTNQSKRDISLSYAATDVDSKRGSRFKTITVIKNLNKDGGGESGGQTQKLTINPELHKNENWADAFRDNFDSYGRIPDVPDIDDLFEFMSKKPKIKSKVLKNEKPLSPLSPSSPSSSSSTSSFPVQSTLKPLSSIPRGKSHKGKMTENEKPVTEPTIETFQIDMMAAKKPDSAIAPMVTPFKNVKNITDSSNKKNAQNSMTSSVEKIKGDAELLPTLPTPPPPPRHRPGSGQKRQSPIIKSQPLILLNQNEKIRDTEFININYSTPHPKFENYVLENTNGYDYPHPCPGGVKNPYIAPSVIKKPNVQVNNQPRYPPYSDQNQQPAYSVNSIIPPIQPTPNNVSPSLLPPRQFNSNNQQNQYISGSGGYSTTQRPYVAPNLRGFNRGPANSPTVPSYNSPTYRTNLYGFNKYNTGRSRGLKY